MDWFVNERFIRFQYFIPILLIFSYLWITNPFALEPGLEIRTSLRDYNPHSGIEPKASLGFIFSNIVDILSKNILKKSFIESAII